MGNLGGGKGRETEKRGLRFSAGLALLHNRNRASYARRTPSAAVSENTPWVGLALSKQSPRRNFRASYLLKVQQRTESSTERLDKQLKDITVSVLPTLPSPGSSPGRRLPGRSAAALLATIPSPHRITPRIGSVHGKFNSPLGTVQKKADILAAATFSRQLILEVIYSPSFPQGPLVTAIVYVRGRLDAASMQAKQNHTQNRYIGHYKAQPALHHASQGSP